MSIANVQVSCACASVLAQPRRLEPGAVSELIMEVEPNAFNLNSQIGVVIRAGEDAARRAICYVQIGAVPPFAGWPECAIATRSGADWVVSFSPEYVQANVRVDAHAFVRGTNRSLGGGVCNGQCAVPVGADMQIDLVVKFGEDGRSTWSGPLVLSQNVKGFP